MHLQHTHCIFATCNLDLCGIFLHLQRIFLCLQCIQGPKIQILGARQQLFTFSGSGKVMVLGTKWVAVARHGLILWENEATGSRKLSKCLRGLKNKYTN